MRPEVHRPIAPWPVRLAVVDVDGCLTPGEGGDWDWKAIQSIRDLNRRAEKGDRVPAVTLCTGRPQPYVEVLMQAIGARMPGIYENGCGLYYPDSYRFVEHPSISAATKDALAAMKAELRQRVIAPGLGYFQPGKEASLTIYPLPGTSVGHLQEAITDALTGHERSVSIQASVSCVDVTPSGIDKGTGVRWLSDEIGIALSCLGGIGDSSSDLKFMRIVGHCGAPANATAEVKTAVEYVSSFEDGRGVVDILQHWCTAPDSDT
jgi:HAD superfamily hydrolase (TIGR01484 family)